VIEGVTRDAFTRRAAHPPANTFKDVRRRRRPLATLATLQRSGSAPYAATVYFVIDGAALALDPSGLVLQAMGLVA
jgi:hypothetical protein